MGGFGFTGVLKFWNHLNMLLCYRSKVGVPGKTEGIIFTPIPCEVVYFEPERAGIKMLRGTLASSSPVQVISEFVQVEK